MQGTSPKNKERKSQKENQKNNQGINDLEVAKKLLKIHQSAVDRKIEFNLSLDFVRKLLSYERCYYTNRKFEEDGIYARSFDRVDSARGYLEDNVVACTVDINTKKSNLTLDEMEILYKKLVLDKKS
jgi:hypothetical protein